MEQNFKTSKLQNFKTSKLFAWLICLTMCLGTCGLIRGWDLTSNKTKPAEVRAASEILNDTTAGSAVKTKELSAGYIYQIELAAGNGGSARVYNNSSAFNIGGTGAKAVVWYHAPEDTTIYYIIGAGGGAANGSNGTGGAGFGYGGYDKGTTHQGGGGGGSSALSIGTVIISDSADADGRKTTGSGNTFAITSWPSGNNVMVVVGGGGGAGSNTSAAPGGDGGNGNMDVDGHVRGTSGSGSKGGGGGAKDLTANKFSPGEHSTTANESGGGAGWKGGYAGGDQNSAAGGGSSWMNTTIKNWNLNYGSTFTGRTASFSKNTAQTGGSTYADSGKAGWMKITQHEKFVEYDLNGGELKSGSMPNGTASIITETTGKALPTLDLKKGHHHDGTAWNTRADGSGTTFAFGQTVTPEQLVGVGKLYAMYESQIVYDANGAKSGVIPQKPYSPTVFAGNDGTGNPTPTPNTGSLVAPDGYNFAKDASEKIVWNSKRDGTGEDYSADSTIPEDFTENGNVTLYAKWTWGGGGAGEEPEPLYKIIFINQDGELVRQHEARTYLFPIDLTSYADYDEEYEYLIDDEIIEDWNDTWAKEITMEDFLEDTMEITIVQRAFGWTPPPPGPGPGPGSIPGGVTPEPDLTWVGILCGSLLGLAAIGGGTTGAIFYIKRRKETAIMAEEKKTHDAINQSKMDAAAAIAGASAGVASAMDASKYAKADAIKIASDQVAAAKEKIEKYKATKTAVEKKTTGAAKSTGAKTTETKLSTTAKPKTPKK